MGKEIEKTAIERGHTINLIIEEHNSNELNTKNTTNTDAVIEFTQPNSVINNISKCFELNLPFITGTTGWYNQIDEIRKKCEDQKQAFIYASNFSIGVNIFFKLNEYIASLINTNNSYIPSIDEIHHTAKIDKPSGTAITLANTIIDNYPNINSWTLDEDSETKLKINSHREEGIVGTHTVCFESDIDKISITHEAYNRKGFALGAVLAAEWLYNKKGFFAFNQIFDKLI